MIASASYLRVSGKGQLTGDGFDRQRDSINRYAKANQITVEKEFVEKGVCGAIDAFDRPALGDLLASIQASGIKLVLVERADRLARDLIVSEVCLSEFRKLGVRVVEAEGGTDLTVEDSEPTKILIRQLLACVAEFEKSTIVRKLKAARDRIRASTGRCEGPKPDKGLTALDLSRIREMRAIGDPFKTIAATMTEYGPNRWHVTTLRAICRRHSIPKLNNELPEPAWLKP